MPLNKAQYFSPAVLENLEQQELVCLDDLQEVIGDTDWEVAIFDLINRGSIADQFIDPFTGFGFSSYMGRSVSINAVK